jgi:UDP-N-acetylglucosamine--N-acetylmuramyl-(pentapeptide) pyrophosphoryl-undecaprenol N-acetylglucosamine transferase
LSKHLVIMAAGTGGHIMPGLAVASEMRARGWTVSWLGTSHGMENKLVPPQGIPMDTITFSGLRGKGLLHTLTGSVRLLAAFWSCLQILRRRAASAVLGMGGYVCFPGGLMASLLGRPLMLMNADAALLLSNKSLLPVADCVAFGFDGEAAKSVKSGVVTGNPVRREIAAIAPPAERFTNRQGALRVLVVGGSLGAQALNEAVPAAVRELQVDKRPVLVHQTGQAQIEAVRAAYRSLGIDADVRPFIDDMALELAQCDVIVCRAGAITVSELCAAGVASILVPLVVSTTSHQRNNAQWMAAKGAAIHLPQTELSATRLTELLSGLDREKLLTMAQSARALALPNASSAVADQLESLVRVKAI